MTDQSRQRPRLLTREQVLAALREERERGGLTRTAEHLGIKPQQICDLLAVPPRTKLSKRMWTQMGYKMHEFFEKLDEGKNADGGKKGEAA